MAAKQTPQDRKKANRALDDVIKEAEPHVKKIEQDFKHRDGE